MLKAFARSIVAASIGLAMTLPSISGERTYFPHCGNSHAVGAAALYLDGNAKAYSGSLLRVASPAYGERCVTKIGWCPIPAQPVGAPCRCGEVEGTTLQ